MTSLTSLLKNTSLDDHESILEAVTGRDTRDIEAQHVKVVALLKLDRFQDALKVFEGTDDTLKTQAQLEWAYTLYKNGRLAEAEEEAARDNKRRSLKHVLAQTSYRAEKFAQVGDLYDILRKQRSGDESSDLKINSGATDAQLGWSGQGHLARKTKPDREDMEQFETAFNAACGYISRGELKQAELLLSRARGLCDAAEELNDEEKRAELLPIIAQQLYVATRLGKLTDAANFAKSLDVSSIPDSTMKSIAQSNTALIAAGDNPYLTQRQIQANSSSSAKDQPFSFQSATMRRNQLALDLQLGKYQGVGKVTLATINQAGDNRTAPRIITAGIFNAAAHARAEPAKSALNQVLPLLERRPYDVGLILVIVQLYVLADKTTTATTLLEAFLARLEGATSSSDHSTSYIPGLVAILVSLYAHQDRTSSIKTQLSKAAAYWRNKPERVLPPTNFLISAGLAMLDQPGDSDIELAQDLFQSVFAQNSQSVIAVAGMAAATTKAGSVSEEIQSRLPTVEKLTAGINVAGLETAGIAKLPATASTATTGSKRAAPPESTTTIPKKKRRQGKLPRDYEPNKQPDPERWLPLRDRSNWRPKGKKGKGRAPGGERGGMTQGGIVSDELSRLTTPAPSAGVVQSKKAASSKKASRKR